MWSEKQAEVLTYLESKHYRNVRQVLFGGAAGPGKTFLGCMWQIARRLAHPGTRGFLGRKELKQLNLTTFRTFMRCWNTYSHNKQPASIKLNGQESVVYFSNGSEIFLMELAHKASDEDFSDLGSLELTDAFIDEVSEITEKAFNILNSRIRYKLIDGVPKCLVASNPQNNWLKTTFVSDDQNIPIDLPDYRKFVPALVTDNPDKDFVKSYIQNLEILPIYDRRRLLEGDWSVRENDYPFFQDFNADKHIGSMEIVDHLPIWLSYDFNYDPTTCIVAQVDLPNIYIIDCIQRKGGTAIVTEIVKELYNDHPSGITITGDNSGHSASSAAGMKSGLAITDFQVISEILNTTAYDFKRPSKVNPKHVVSRKIINHAFKNLNILIHPRCTVLINDIQNAQVREDGKLAKDRDSNKQDAGDAFRYLIHAALPHGIKTINSYI